jgi:hypothetical protein
MTGGVMDEELRPFFFARKTVNSNVDKITPTFRLHRAVIFEFPISE